MVAVTSPRELSGSGAISEVTPRHHCQQPGHALPEEEGALAVPIQPHREAGGLQLTWRRIILDGLQDRIAQLNCEAIRDHHVDVGIGRESVVRGSDHHPIPLELVHL